MPIPSPLYLARKGSERILRYLPWWMLGPVAQTLARALGEQVDRGVKWRLGNELHASTAASELGRWEDDYGLPRVTTDSLEVRRARVVALLSGAVARTLADFTALVTALVRPKASGPLAVITNIPARLVIWQAGTGVFPTNYDDVFAALWKAKPTHMGLYVAPGLTLDELSGEQWDHLPGHVLDALAGGV